MYKHIQTEIVFVCILYLQTRFTFNFELLKPIFVELANTAICKQLQKIYGFLFCKTLQSLVLQLDALYTYT